MAIDAQILDDIKIPLIAKDISYIQKDISEIKQSVKDLSGVYATQIKLDETNEKIDKLAASSQMWRWLSPSLAAILSSVMTFLVINFLQHSK